MFSIPSFNLRRIACFTCSDLSPFSFTAAPRPQHRTRCSFQHSSGIAASATSHPRCEVQISPVSSAPTDARKLRAPSSLRRIRSTCTFRSQHYPEKKFRGRMGGGSEKCTYASIRYSSGIGSTQSGFSPDLHHSSKAASISRYCMLYECSRFVVMGTLLPVHS